MEIHFRGAGPIERLSKTLLPPEGLRLVRREALHARSPMPARLLLRRRALLPAPFVAGARDVRRDPRRDPGLRRGEGLAEPSLRDPERRRRGDPDPPAPGLRARLHRLLGAA